MSDPVTEFVERGPVPVDRLEVGVGPGHSHVYPDSLKIRIRPLPTIPEAILLPA
jgi:hypothetical protein